MTRASCYRGVLVVLRPQGRDLQDVHVQFQESWVQSPNQPGVAPGSLGFEQRTLVVDLLDVFPASEVLYP